MHVSIAEFYLYLVYLLVVLGVAVCLQTIKIKKYSPGVWHVVADAKIE